MINVKFDRQEIDELYDVMSRHIKKSNNYHLETAFISILISSGIANTEDQADEMIKKIKADE